MSVKTSDFVCYRIFSVCLLPHKKTADDIFPTIFVGQPNRRLQTLSLSEIFRFHRLFGTRNIIPRVFYSVKSKIRFFRNAFFLRFRPQNESIFLLRPKNFLFLVMAEQNFELIKIISQNKDGRKIQKRVHDCDGKAETQPIFERHTENDKKADEYTDIQTK